MTKLVKSHKNYKGNKKAHQGSLPESHGKPQGSFFVGEKPTKSRIQQTALHHRKEDVCSLIRIQFNHVFIYTI